jgi:hypothetical protein
MPREARRNPWARSRIEHSGDRQAALLVCPTRDDITGLRELVPQERILHLPPFLDLEAYRECRRGGENRSASL